MNDSMMSASLTELPLPQVLSTLEQSFFFQRPPREFHFYLEAREALLLRPVIEHEREYLVRGLIIIARSCFASASPRDGLLALERAEQIVSAMPDSDLKRQLHTVKGALAMDLGDFTQAFESHARALDLSRRLAHRDSEARSITNLAALFCDFGAPWDALKLGEQVLEMNRQMPTDRVLLAAALNTMAEACLATHQAERGIELASRVLLQSPSEQAPQRAHLCIAHVLLARLHLMRGRISAAERELLGARHHEQSTGFSRAKLKVAIAAALIDHEKGKLRQAVQSLKEALVLAGSDAGLAKDALSALITIYEKEGHPKSALKYLQRLSALSERVNLDQVRERLIELGLAEDDGHDNSLVENQTLSSNDFRLQTAALRKKLIDSQVEVLERLAIAAELRDDVTGMHCYRVGKWANLIALEMGLPAIEADTIEIAARLHDIGKVGVPDHILMKPDRLTPAETEIMRRHAVLGARLLSRSKTPQIRLAEKVAMSHHERWDGGGYPQGLARDAIPLAGRITAVADVFDALTHERPYKHAWPVDEALRMMQTLSGSWFDPSVLSAFFSVVERLSTEKPNLDEAIESRLKRSRIMRIREYVMGNDHFSPDDTGSFRINLDDQAASA